MGNKIFISYRREDSAGHAGRVHDRLRQALGNDLLFMDVDAIPLGTNFVKVLREEVDRCDMLIAVIGQGWLEARDGGGKRRLDDPNDFVRIEVAAALKRNVPVVPLLLDGALVPRPEDLPEDLRELSYRQGLHVRHSTFHADLDKLVNALTGGRSAEPAAQPEPAPAPPPVQGPNEAMWKSNGTHYWVRVGSRELPAAELGLIWWTNNKDLLIQHNPTDEIFMLPNARFTADEVWRPVGEQPDGETPIWRYAGGNGYWSAISFRVRLRGQNISGEVQWLDDDQSFEGLMLHKPTGLVFFIPDMRKCKDGLWRPVDMSPGHTVGIWKAWTDPENKKMNRYIVRYGGRDLPANEVKIESVSMFSSDRRVTHVPTGTQFLLPKFDSSLDSKWRKATAP